MATIATRPTRRPWRRPGPATPGGWKCSRVSNSASPTATPSQLEWANRQDFDVIIGSVHWLGDAWLGDRALTERMPLPAIFEGYYGEVLAAVRCGGFDILAHPDLPKRYWHASHEPESLLDEIFAAMVAGGVALEINTSPLRRGGDETCPGPSLLARYIHQSGRRMTLGSDAHRATEVGADLDHALALAQAAGGEVGLLRERHFVPLGDTP